MYLTQVRKAPSGTSFSILQATVQAWQPMHLRWSITKPYFKAPLRQPADIPGSYVGHRAASRWRPGRARLARPSAGASFRSVAQSPVRLHADRWGKQPMAERLEREGFATTFVALPVLRLRCSFKIEALLDVRSA